MDDMIEDGVSHKERLIDLLTDMGVKRRDGVDFRDIYVWADSFLVDPTDNDKTLNEVIIGTGTGYSGFGCGFRFDDQGNYVEHFCFE